MTEYFEIHERDGMARLGELRLADPVSTPACADDVLADAGSLWAADRSVPEGDETALTVLPHRGFPAGTREPVRESFRVDHPDVTFPSAAVISAADPAAAVAETDASVDAYVLSDATGFVGHGSAFVDAIVRVKEAIPADTALVCSGVATPVNVATLAYAGVDLVDGSLARVKGAQGKYLTNEGEHFLEDLEELPCACSACSIPREEFTREDCEAHNLNALEADLRRVRHRIRRGRLRDYIEGQARHDQWLTATFREFDERWGHVERHAPVIRESEITAASGDTLERAEIKRFADRVSTRYRCRFDAPLVLVPCSATKPYSDSRSHRQFQDAIGWRGHVVSMTSPIGVVPQELETTYPAQHYDSVVTGRWSGDETAFVAEVLGRYLERNEYPRVIAHLPEDYLPIVERIEDGITVPIDYTCGDHPTTDASLERLSEALAGEETYSKREREHNTVRAIADYQFGDGSGRDGTKAAGDRLFGADVDLRTNGRYPKLQAWDGPAGDEGTQLATMVPQYGVLSLTLAGAERWVDSDVATRTVEIDGFVPRGSVLAPGVVDADDSIRVGDEVVVDGPRAFAVGRAEMHGREMAESTRGIAVSVRHVEER